jgi:hypothetical protein
MIYFLLYKIVFILSFLNSLIVPIFYFQLLLQTKFYMCFGKHGKRKMPLFMSFMKISLNKQIYISKFIFDKFFKLNIICESKIRLQFSYLEIFYNYIIEEF